MSATFANSSNYLAALKELYVDSQDYMQNLVYKINPFFALVPKLETEDGFSGKYIPVPIQFANPQGRSHAFANAQGQQTPSSIDSFFVSIISDYEVVTITQLLMEQTKSSAGAFIDAAKNEVDNGIRNISNNIAFELFGDGSGSRGVIGSGTNPSGNTYVITLSNSQQVVNFEQNMTLVNFALSGGTISSISSTQAIITAVNRITGVLTVTATGSDSSWTTAGNQLGIYGDIVTGTVGTSTMLTLAGLQAWLPFTDPTPGVSFWNVDRSADRTRLAGIAYDASAQTIEEGLTNALALVNREGGTPDMIFMDFASFAALVNSLGAKVQYVQIKHDEVDVAFEGITFVSAYGRVTVTADRSCPPQTAFILTMDTWKLRSLGKVPHILTYGMEGLEGLRVGNADALEVRIGCYHNLICSAPGRNAIVKLSS